MRRSFTAARLSKRDLDAVFKEHGEQLGRAHAFPTTRAGCHLLDQALFVHHGEWSRR